MNGTETRDCYGEMIDGIWNSCDCCCEDCLQADHEAIEAAHEDGSIDEDEAYARHAANGDH